MLSTAPEARPLDLLCTRAALDRILETTFIREELLGGLRRPLRIRSFQNASDVPLIGDSLFLVLDDDLACVVLQAIRKGCRNVGVLHMGDEFHTADRSYYPLVDYVVRHYHRPDVLEVPAGSRCKCVCWVPNGYRTGVGPRNSGTLMPQHLRESVLFFAGCLTTGGAGVAERAEMINIVRANNLPATIITTEGFGGGLSAGAYAALMENAQFALVPAGRSAETIRLYDALETGTIPITLRHSFLEDEGPLRGAPFVFLDSWHDLPGWLATSTSPINHRRHSERQSACITWWSKVKQTYRAAVADLIESSFSQCPASSFDK